MGDALRAKLRERVRAMSPEERVELAVRLGEEDLAALAESRGLERRDPLRLLRRSRRVGRRLSEVMETIDP